MTMSDKDPIHRVLDKLDKIDDRLSHIDKILVKQEVNLQEHMRRSDLLEHSQDKLEEAILPLLKIHTVAWGIAKIVSAVAVVLGILKFFLG